MNIFHNNYIKINLNDYLLNFNKYESQYDLTKERFIEISNEFNIKELDIVKVPNFKGCKFTSLNFLSPWDSLPIKINLTIDSQELMLLFYKDIKISFLYDTEIYLLIYVNDCLKYKFATYHYTLNNDYEIYCVRII